MNADEYIKEHGHEIWWIKPNNPDLTTPQLVRLMEDYAKYKIHTPETNDFMEGVKVEMAFHKDKWGDESHKSLIHFASVLSYLVGKLIKAIWDADTEKIKHHFTTIAAVAGTAFNYFKIGNK